LDKIFSATEVVNMDEQKLRALAGESEQARAERLELEQKVIALQHAQRECLGVGVIHERQAFEPAPSIRVTDPATTPSPSPLRKPSTTPNMFSFPYAMAKTTNSSPTSTFGTFKPTPPSGKSPLSGGIFSSVPLSQTTGLFGGSTSSESLSDDNPFSGSSSSSSLAAGASNNSSPPPKPLFKF
jgi:hypothetical protein